MAITTGGLYYITWRDLLITAQLAIDLDLETHKGALFTDTLAPAFDTDSAQYGVSPYDTNETNGGSWPAGGVALTTTVVSVENSEDLTFDAANVSVATTDITAGMGYFLYADALGNNNGIVLVDFGTAVTTVNGTFEITWTAPGSGGVFNIDLVG